MKNHYFNREITNRLNTLSISDNWHALLNLGVDYAFMVLATVAAIKIPYLYPLSVLVIGARQRALATIMHDAAHSRAAKWKWLNSLLGKQLTGYPIFQSFTAYKKSHVMKHHAFLGNESKDPDYVFYKEIGLFSIKSKKQFFMQHVLGTISLINSPQYIYYLLKNRLGSFREDRKDLAEFLVFWSAICALVVYLNVEIYFLLYWIVPYFTAFQVIGRFIEIAEHYPMVGNEVDVLKATRNRFSHPLEAFFLSIHQENFHLVHHLRPGIPFWNMTKAHRIMMEDDDYCLANRNFGGVFLSSNTAPALIPGFTFGVIALPVAS